MKALPRLNRFTRGTDAQGGRPKSLVPTPQLRFEPFSRARLVTDAVVAGWPLLLTGPMVRRVEPKSVSVFVLVKHQRSVKLDVFPAGSTNTVVATGTADTIQIGRYMHASLVTATLTNPLADATNYAYNVTFTKTGNDPLDVGPVTQNLGDLGLLAGATPLGYEAGALPTFALPPNNLGDLKFVHASCRKPHAPGDDALCTLDTIIQNTHNEPLQRPHQVFFTGDQIYADDVAQPLLAQLTSVGDQLLSWLKPEIIPTVSKSAADLKPGSRQTVMDAAHFSSSDADSHLLTFGEFCAMYASVWSDALWPVQLPAFAAIYKDEDDYLQQGRRVDPAQPAVADSTYEKYLAHSLTYGAQATAVDTFRAGLAKVRRALANVPSYMIFDDHEVSDDWYIDQNWKQQVLGTELGVRVITNALSGYSVFQGWGNDPAQFSDGSGGRELLGLLSQWDGTPGTTYDSIRGHLQVGGNSPQAIQWDYEIDFAQHQVIFLDTRTKRDYPGGGENQPTLIGAVDLKRQLSDRCQPGKFAVTILISAAPVFGHPFVERVVQRGFFARLLGGDRGPERGIDRESWYVKDRPAPFEGLLARLVAFERVVILTGDVHYGFTVKVRYWDQHSVPERRAAIVQFCSSAAKNQSGLTKAVATLSSDAGTFTDGYLGWDQEGKHVSMLGLRLTVKGTPAVARVANPLFSWDVVDPPQWRYRTEFCVDFRGPIDRQVPDPPPLTSSGASWLQKQQADAWRHRQQMKYQQMRMIVGYNNMSLVTFTASPPSYLAWQSLWYTIPEAGGSTPAPYTVHSADLTVPDQDEIFPTPTSAGAGYPSLAEWASLISFRPPPDIQTGLKNWLGGQTHFHRIEAALGPINIDLYPVLITTPPQSGGVAMTPADVLARIRQLIIGPQAILDTTISEFNPYAGETRWDSADPTGAVISIAMKMWPKDDRGSVVTTSWSSSHWIFSTAWTPLDWGHPVSGNRMFSIIDNGDGTWTFFNRGADRATMWVDYGAATMNIIWNKADSLWRSLQQGVVKYVNDNQGAASIDSAHTSSIRYDWGLVSANYYSPSPTSPWL